MGADVYYAEERQKLPEPYATKLTDAEAEYIYTRLQSKYKIRQLLVWRRMHACAGRCGHHEITLCPDTNVGVLAHEVGHAIRLKKGRLKIKNGEPVMERWHNKKHFNAMKRVAKFVMAKLPEWQAFVKYQAEKKAESERKKAYRETAIAALKKSPDFVLGEIRYKIKKWETKKKRAETAIKKLRRKEKLWQGKVLISSGSLIRG